MTQALRDLMDRYNQLSLRERVLVLLAAVALLWVVWESAFMGPLDRERRQRRQQLEVLRAEVQGLEQSVEAIVAQGAADPESRSRQQIEALKQDIAKLDEQLAGTTSGLIAPREMGRVLEQVLRRTSQLTLHGLRTLPPESLLTAEPPKPEGGAQIYRHGVELEVGGTYLEMLRLLEALEALPWKFFWDRAEFAIEDAPRGRLKLRLYTLGLEEGWIGV
jgi:MSHA biogenesis protein MshJ